MRISDIELWDGKSDPRPREVWVPASGFESLYLVSSFGRILRITGGRGVRFKRGQNCRLLRPKTPNSKGYLSVRLCNGKRVRSVKVHTIIIESFYGIPTDKFGPYEIHHIKADEKTNNRLDNLECKTAKDNREEQWHRYYTKGEVVW
jgi:hypothetical protein